MKNINYFTLDIKQLRIAKAISAIVIGLLLFYGGVANADKLAGEYFNKSQSVLFDPADMSVIMEIEVFGSKTTVHGKYKIKGNKVYVFDLSGMSYGTFELSNNVLKAEGGSTLRDLASTSAVKKRISEIEKNIIGKWYSASDDSGYWEILSDHIVEIRRYASNEVVRINWKLVSDKKIKFYSMQRGGNDIFADIKDRDRLNMTMGKESFILTRTKPKK